MEVKFRMIVPGGVRVKNSSVDSTQRDLKTANSGRPNRSNPRSGHNTAPGRFWPVRLRKRKL